MEQLPIEKVAIDAMVEIIANGSCYRGRVVRLSSDEGKITLKEAQIVQDGKIVSSVGQLHFFRDDIQSMKFLDEEAVLGKMDPNYLLMQSFRKPFHLRGQTIPTDDEILKFSHPSPKNTDEDPDEIGGSCFSDSIISHVVDEIGEDFQATISVLKAQKGLGVAAEGISLSRHGELCWLAISIPTHVYLFDMITLGEKAFLEGLTDILQSTRIVKVMHDCRFLSDYLFHKHQIFLQNVWDTQVARIVIYKAHHSGDIPRFADSLPKTLQDVLGVDPNKFPIIWYRSYALEQDQSIWRRLPLPDELQKALEGQVKYLLELRNALLEKLMADLTMGVDIYLKTVRDARSTEVGSMLKSKFLIPSEFQKSADAANERYTESNRTSAIDPLTGFRESMGRLSYWKLRFSRDAWHGKLGGSGDVKEEEEDGISEEECLD